MEGKYQVLKSDPGNSLFVEYAEELRVEGQIQEALVVCLKGLSSNPSNHSGRLVLARLLYQLGCTPFAAEQLAIIQREVPDNAPLNKLIIKLGGEASSKPTETSGGVIAEADFDVGDLEALGDEYKQ